MAARARKQRKPMTAMPPLLALAHGCKVRPRRERIPVPRELSLHMPVAKLLDDHCLPDWRHTHFPSGELRNLRTAGKLKAMGLKPGWPDFLLLSPRLVLHSLELKRPGGELSDDQEDFRDWVLAHGGEYEVAWTIDLVLAVFDRWGCLRVKIPKRGDRRG